MSDITVKYRRDLHKIPELGQDTVRTSEYIKKALSDTNCRITSPIPGSVCAYFDAGRPTAKAFRSDMDALPVSERSNVPYRSQIDGCMHACGHDGHMAMLLDFAHFVDAHISELPSNILLIFQPAEETTGGAKYICESGILKEHRAEAIFGIHLWPDLPFGEIATIDGGMMARSAEVSLTVEGRSAHIARAEKGRDALMAAVEFMTRSYRMTETEPEIDSHRILRFGKLSSGSARNIISGESRLLGSMRTLDDPTFELMQKRMQEIAKEVELETSCKLDLHFSEGYPAVVNDPCLYKTVVSAYPDTVKTLPEPVMIAEDFAYYSKCVKSLFFFLGLGTEQPLHSPDFDFDDSVLKKGCELYQKLAFLKL
ncbi:MAG: amidohydrolase [Firmicutes bacterium]|nr:amidohydrolase [Bacillota bacterium]